MLVLQKNVAHKAKAWPLALLFTLFSLTHTLFGRLLKTCFDLKCLQMRASVKGCCSLCSKMHWRRSSLTGKKSPPYNENISTSVSSHILWIPSEASLLQAAIAQHLIVVNNPGLEATTISSFMHERINASNTATQRKSDSTDCLVVLVVLSCELIWLNQLNSMCVWD